MHGRTLGGVVIGLGLAAAVPAGQVFRTGVDLVTVGVTVTDRSGAVVSGLTREDFEVVEDGRPQALVQFSAGLAEAGRDPVPTHLGLLLDTSGSMEADLELSRRAAIKFLNTLPNAEDITLVDFDTEVRVARYGQREFPRLVERIRGRAPEGYTALYDALGVYLDGAEEQDGRKILVLYTDGDDTRSILRYGDLLTLLKASSVTVHAVGFLDHQGSAASQSRMRIMQIVELTGGQAFFPGKLADLDDAYARVVAEIRGQYHLAYASTNATADGAWRKVDVRVTRPGLRVRARKGYFAPYRAPAPPR